MKHRRPSGKSLPKPRKDEVAILEPASASTQFLETRFADLVDKLQARTPPEQDPLLVSPFLLIRFLVQKV